MDTIERAVIVPAAEVIVHRAARREVFRQRGPLAPRAQNIHHPVDDFPLVNGSLVAAPLGGWNERPDERPLLIRQVAGVAQLAAIIPATVLCRPHPKAPANRTAAIESQVIPTIQAVPGWALRSSSSAALVTDYSSDRPTTRNRLMLSPCVTI
jgi:hypothetical protein